MAKYSRLAHFLHLEGRNKKTKTMKEKEEQEVQPSTGSPSINSGSGTEDQETLTVDLKEEDELQRLQNEIDELKDRNLRQMAEFDNYRKRTIKEKTELILNGSRTAVTALLPVVDDLERALPSMKNAQDVAAVAEGVELILQKFLKTLEGMGVKQINTNDADFDVDLHEAIAQVPGVPDAQKGKVIDCVEKGYMLNETVIRHAKVAVGM